MNGKIWTEEQITYLVQHYADSKTEVIALHLGRLISGVYSKASELGLKKSEAFLQSEASGRMGKSHQGSKNTQFKKGFTPWNKGKKGLQIGGVQSHFPKGNLPHNTKYDGATSVRSKKGDPPYEYIRVAKAKWVLHHRYRWEQEVGPIPKGHMLRCKDGNTLNTDPSNWEPITKRENRDRNHNPEKAYLNGPFYNLSDNYVATMITMKEKHLKEDVKQYPELLELARANMLLKREINQKLKD